MAERLEPGLQTIFYRAANFKTGLDITVRLLNPDFTKSVPIPLIEVDKEPGDFPGLYYFEYTFHEGNYVAYFYEVVTQRRWCQAYNILWASGEAGKIINIDHGTTKTVIERKGDPTFPMERTSEINEPIERGSG